MREILFRGKRADNGEWVEGSLLYDSEQNESYIAKHFEDKAAYLREVLPETVGQYIGLTDKNGKKIFEGDIIKRMWNGSLSIYHVVFNKYLSAFIGETKPHGRFTTFDGDGEWFEVIGNIHDNPELLKGE